MHTFSGEPDTTRTIVTRIATREGVSPLELPPLSTAIDPTVIESLPEEARLTFPYLGYEVTVEDGRRVTVRTAPAEEQRPDA